MSDALAAQAVLEEALSMAIERALELRNAPESDQFDRGQLHALYTQIHWIKEQAEILGVEFGDENLRRFDPDKELLNYKRAA